MQFSKYTAMLKTFGFIYTLKYIFNRFFLKLRKLLYKKSYEKTFRYLKRYLHASTDYSYCFNVSKEPKPYIWTLWFQGLDNAPPIVKSCIASIKKHSCGYEVIVLTGENLSDYITMPDFIIRKYNEGIISKAHFSDILRTLLLINYGGIWIDATVLLTRDIPPYILNSDIFVFQSSLFKHDIVPCSSWFIAAKKDNPILKKIFSILMDYWKRNNILMNYYFFHCIIDVVITEDIEAKELWYKMPYKNNSDVHFLQRRLFDKLDPDLKEYIWNLSFAHKLTYKFQDASLVNLDKTYYQYIVQG